MAMTKMLNFHTPQLPQPLSLDFADLSGGGAAPSQFYGRTHDGREVYVRYRSGILRVEVAKKPDADFLDPEVLLDVDIGPGLDGYITCARFCTLFGVTVNGAIPPETDVAAYRQTDLSGRTSYCGGSLGNVSDRQARTILAGIMDEFPGALLCQPNFTNGLLFEGLTRVSPDTASTSKVWIIPDAATLQDVETSPEDYIVAKPDQLQIEIIYTPWSFPNAPGRLSLYVSFPTGDAVLQNLERVDAKIAEILA